MISDERIKELCGLAVHNGHACICSVIKQALREQETNAAHCCPKCKGSGEVEGNIPHPFSGDPQDDEWGTVQCSDCKGTGEAVGAAPTQRVVPVEPDDALLAEVAVIAGVWPASDKENVPYAIRQAIRKYHKAMLAAAPATVPVEPVAWIHCSPELLASGIDCGTTPRRPCECAIKGSHDHLIRIAHPADTFRRAIERAAWMPIETAPKDGRTMLLGHFNDCGKWRTLRGQWFSKEQIAEEWENDENEEGWYETSVENDDIPNCWPTDPSHWQPLPAPPAAP